MKYLFWVIGIYIGAVTDEWSSTVFGLFIDILAGPGPGYRERMVVLWINI